MSTSLINLLTPTRLTEIVDIGANPIDGNPPYTPMLSQGLCQVTGFEPQASALARLNTEKGAYERYLPYAIGDGQEHRLHICAASGMTSLLEPDPDSLKLFDPFTTFGQVQTIANVQTKKLDEVDEISHLDFLKIDIQGGELAVFNHGKTKLIKTVAVQTEVSFFPLYKNQPALGDIDQCLRSMNFIPHHLAELKRWPISPTSQHGGFGKINQLLEADLVYVKNYKKPDLLDSEQFKHLALIAALCSTCTKQNVT